MQEIDLDRAAGALLGCAAGDALGAGYEFTVPGPDQPIVMRGGGPFGFAPGEWTDDTAQAVAIARVAVSGSLDLPAIAQGFLDWYAAGPKDVGTQTRRVLGATRDPFALAAVAARDYAANPMGAGGNGSLMRTAPVALAHLGDDVAIAEQAMAVSALTHGDPEAGEACLLWCIAIDRAVREGRLDGIRDGLALLPQGSRDRWALRLDEAEATPPSAFCEHNGWVVVALQAAHAAVQQTPVPEADPSQHLRDALVAAVRIGNDTDTVAAIAGQLLGARWGASAIPEGWRTPLHGWPGLTGEDLVDLAHRIIGSG